MAERKKLDPRTRDMVWLHLHGVPMSLIGRKYKVSKQRTKQILDRAGALGKRQRLIEGYLTRVKT